MSDPRNDLSVWEHTKRGALGGVKWSGITALILGSFQVVTRTESAGVALLLQLSMMAIWISIASLVGLSQGLAKKSRRKR